MVVEVAGGYISNSIAIMTDAAHLLSDLLSFFVGIFALRLALKGKDCLNEGTNLQYGYGYHRAEVIGALMSIGIIWVLTGWLLFEAILRFIKPPEDFDAKVMMYTAILGIAVNILMGLTLHQGSHKHFHTHIGGGTCSGHHHHAHEDSSLAEFKHEHSRPGSFIDHHTHRHSKGEEELQLFSTHDESREGSSLLIEDRQTCMQATAATRHQRRSRRNTTRRCTIMQMDRRVPAIMTTRR